MTTPATATDGRHRVGTIYACDARNFGADRRLCPLHAAAPALFAALERIVTRPTRDAITMHDIAEGLAAIRAATREA